ncbi:MAG: lysine 2,3-aminomutase [Clostridiales bacterium]|jgi:KamA family protein|nr:lysine 2,3-aminomutase [Clostridiales bacterium]MDK2933260.1 lysine 2,3-aminomutase [Clostridiales bacterium]
MSDWRKELKNTITTVQELKQYMPLSEKEEKELEKIIDRHPMSIPTYYLNLIDWNDPNDPIKKLSIPSGMELDMSGDYDTSGEAQNTKFAGVQHKYAPTVLVLSTNACLMYCRHCFRKRMVGYSQDEIMSRLDETINYLKTHKEVNNVLISGGDSFVLPTSTIKEYLTRLAEIEHLDFIRFGTRIPVVYPQRIIEDKELLETLKEYTEKNKPIYVVTQFNHPKELTEEAKEAIILLKKAGVSVNNQTVFLMGINDDPETLAKLQRDLTNAGVNPYYVFQCRPVKYVKNHFQVPIYEAYQTIELAKQKLNGISKRFRYIMSHKRGKIEIVGVSGNKMIFKFHQAKNKEDYGRIFELEVDKKARWLDDELHFIE